MQALAAVVASALVVVGCVAAGSALLTPPPVDSAAPRVAVDDLRPRQHKWVPHPVQRPGADPVDLLLIRGDDQRILAFQVPVRNGQRLLPGASLSAVAAPCERVQVGVDEQRIRCVRSTGADSIWRLDGTPAEATATRLVRLTGHEEDGSFLLY
ncbi:MAG: hypothetical protein ACKVQR_18330 [Aquabacterium sp.]